MARRFVVNEKDISNINEDTIAIYGSEVEHIQVLRFNVGDAVTVNDGIYKIVEMKRDTVYLQYIKKANEVGVPSSNVTLYIALLKNDKLDFVIQKAVELGVKKIVPFTSSNVVVKLDDKSRQKRIEKLNKVAIEACKQCGRTDYVNVLNVLNFKNLKETLKNEKRVLFAYEASKDSLKKEINDIKEENINDIGIVIGAEGGFTESEAEELKNIENVKCVSLGTRILRAETAALNLISIVMYELEE